MYLITKHYNSSKTHHQNQTSTVDAHIVHLR